MQEALVSFELSDAEILGSSLDEDGTRLYDRDRGHLRVRGNDEMTDAAGEKAEDRALDVARENSILEKT